MRKTTLLLAVLLVSLLGFSQNALYGVRAGINISDLNFEEADGLIMPDHTHRNGFAIGFFGDYKFSENVGLLVEIQFSAEGSKEKYDQIDQESGYNPESLRLDFVQMPIMARIKLTDKLTFGLGPQVDVAASLPQATTYEGGIQGLSSGGLYDQAVAELAARRPGQAALIDQQFIDPYGTAQDAQAVRNNSQNPAYDPEYEEYKYFMNQGRRY